MSKKSKPIKQKAKPIKENKTTSPIKKKFGGKQEGAGRPKKDIDEQMVYRLAQTMLPVESIATVLECTRETLYARFSDVLQKGREDRKQALSSAMWEKALIEKDTKMMIWLSKQHLGYKDSQPEEAQQIIYNVNIKESP